MRVARRHPHSQAGTPALRPTLLIAPGSIRAFDMPRSAAIVGPQFMNRNPHVAVVGATGAVGVEMIKTLERRNFPVARLTLLASARSAGKQLGFRGESIPIKELGKDSFQGVDIALFSA